MAKPTEASESFYRSQWRHAQQCWFEARVVGVLWLLTLVYCTTVFTLQGYLPPDQRPDQPALVWGIPAWVFWGLFLPWFVLIGLTWAFAFWILKEDEPYSELPADDVADARDD